MQSMKNHNSPASRLRVEPTAAEQAEQEASHLSVWHWKVLLRQRLEHSSANMEKNMQEKAINMSRPR